MKERSKIILRAFVVLLGVGILVWVRKNTPSVLVHAAEASRQPPAALGTKTLSAAAVEQLLYMPQAASFKSLRINVRKSIQEEKCYLLIELMDCQSTYVYTNLFLSPDLDALENKNEVVFTIQAMMGIRNTDASRRPTDDVSFTRKQAEEPWGKTSWRCEIPLEFATQKIAIKYLDADGLHPIPVSD